MIMAKKSKREGDEERPNGLVCRERERLSPSAKSPPPPIERGKNTFSPFEKGGDN
jgi:hypothetical protein